MGFCVNATKSGMFLYDAPGTTPFSVERRRPGFGVQAIDQAAKGVGAGNIVEARQLKPAMEFSH